MIRPLVLTLLLIPLCAAAQLGDSRLPISLDADFSDYDGKNSMLTFRGLRLSQGSIGIEADEGRASKLDFEDSVWQLAGNVVITVDGGRIECDTADLEFTDNALRIANIAGAPATFELSRTGSDDTTYAEAGLLRYDLRAGAIEFSDSAKIVEGGNQIASDYLVYDIAEQRIKAQGSGEADGKVKITFTPRDEGSEADAEISEEVVDQGSLDEGVPADAGVDSAAITEDATIDGDAPE